MEINEGEERVEEGKEDDGLKNNHHFVETVVHNDSFYLETGKITIDQSHRSFEARDWSTILKLAFQSIGVVYGDLGTSPLYTLPGIFQDGIHHPDDLLAALSLIIYSILFITIIKYVFIVLSANDNGNGGTFALYSLICRYAKVGFTPNQEAEDEQVSNYRLKTPNRRLERASFVKSLLEKSQFAKYLLLIIAIIGTSMVIGDGVLTPCISVLSAVGGVKAAATSLTDNMVTWISVAILIFLFQVQRFGTDKIGYSFAPILTIWFLFIGVIGIFNFVKYDPGVIKALNPWYIVKYFEMNGKSAWISLGGVVLCLTGSEALFADLAHFNIRSIQISSCALVIPSVILAYTGQASYLRKHMDDVSNTFYSSVPKPIYWPMFAVAVMAAIIASQSLISASFSIVQQSLALGCFPRVKVVHTSSKYEGQVYVPEINTLLMLACVGVTLGFKNTISIGNAFGIAVVFVFTLTSAFLIIVMIMIWKTNIFFVLLYVLTIGLIELIFFSSVLYKFREGGYFPLVVGTILVITMYTWNYGHRKKYAYELENKVSVGKLKEIASDLTMQRLPGLAIFYTDLVQGVSPIFTHYMANVPALHSVMVFVSIKTIPISKVPKEERFLFRRVEPHQLAIFRCVVRYGYTDVKEERDSFEAMMIDELKTFIQDDFRTSHGDEESVMGDEANRQREVELVDDAVGRGGVIYLIGESEIIASERSGWGNKLMTNYGYKWLDNFARQEEEVFKIPRKRLLKVGMIYEV